MGLSSQESACGATLPTLIARLRQHGKTVPMEQATAAMEYLGSDTVTHVFNQPQRKEIAEIVKSIRHSNYSSTPSKRNTWITQSNKFAFNYFPAVMWAVFESNDTLINKLKHLAEFMVKNLGMRYPDNATRKLALSIVVLASKRELEPQDFYDHLHLLSGFIERKRGAMQTNQTMEDFPSDPNEFLKVYPDAFGDDKPVDCRIDVSLIPEMMHKDVAPSRCTNGRVHRQSTPSKCKPSSTAPAHQQNTTRQPNTNSELLGLLRDVMFNRSGSSMDHNSSGPPPSLQPRKPLIDDQPSSGASPPQHDVPSGGIRGKCADAPPLNSSQWDVHDKLRALSADIMKSSGSAADTSDGGGGDDDGDGDDTPIPKKKEKATQQKNSHATQKRKTQKQTNTTHTKQVTATTEKQKKRTQHRPRVLPNVSPNVNPSRRSLRRRRPLRKSLRRRRSLRRSQ